MTDNILCRHVYIVQLCYAGCDQLQLFLLTREVKPLFDEEEEEREERRRLENQPKVYMNSDITVIEQIGKCKQDLFPSIGKL